MSIVKLRVLSIALALLAIALVATSESAAVAMDAGTQVEHLDQDPFSGLEKETPPVKNAGPVLRRFRRGGSVDATVSHDRGRTRGEVGGSWTSRDGKSEVRGHVYGDNRGNRGVGVGYTRRF